MTKRQLLDKNGRRLSQRLYCFHCEVEWHNDVFPDRRACPWCGQDGAPNVGPVKRGLRFR